MAKCFPMVLALGGVLFLDAPNLCAAESLPPAACAHLAAQVEHSPQGAVFLPSYPTAEPGPLQNTAFLYDNAAAVIALVGCGEKDKAARIGAAMLWALEHDRAWQDGRLRNAYAAGSVGESPVKLAGWWDKAQNRWLEDGYQVGSDTGNMAWAMLALLTLDEPRFWEGAAWIGNWMAQTFDKKAPAGFAGGAFGHEPTPAMNTWKSTEHNTDLAAAFTLLAARSGESGWRDRADIARRFVDAMWSAECACFAAGTGNDGMTRNPKLALDAQIWPLTALPGAAAKNAAAIATADKRLRVGDGFAYGEARSGVWTEGTAQAALLFKLLGRMDEVRRLTAVIDSQRTPDGGFYATNVNALPTGFGSEADPSKPRLYFRLPHLGALAWAALAERGFNPFTATTKLP